MRTQPGERPRIRVMYLPASNNSGLRSRGVAVLAMHEAQHVTNWCPAAQDLVPQICHGLTCLTRALQHLGLVCCMPARADRWCLT